MDDRYDTERRVISVLCVGLFNIFSGLGIFVIVKSNYADIVFAALLEDRAYRSHTYLFGTLFLLIAQKREFSVAYHSRGKSCVAAALGEYLNGFRVVRLIYGIFRRLGLSYRVQPRKII